MPFFAGKKPTMTKIRQQINNENKQGNKRSYLWDHALLSSHNDINKANRLYIKLRSKEIIVDHKMHCLKIKSRKELLTVSIICLVMILVTTFLLYKFIFHYI